MPIAGPGFLMAAYFVGLYLLLLLFSWLLPGYSQHLPIGGLQELANAAGGSDLEQFERLMEPAPTGSNSAMALLLAIAGAVLVIVPVSWVYFITTRTKQVDRSFAQTIVVLPVVVTAIAMIVQHSLALAFSLAGVVAAVRFRFALEEPAHALYVFAAIAVGLGAGTGSVDIAFVLSIGFVFVNLLLWRLDYGQDLTTPFFSFLTGRGRDDNEL